MITDVYGERKTQEVMKETFGHLAPKVEKQYKGFMVYAHSAYGDIVLIDACFKDLDDSPWLFENMNNFIAENGKRGDLYKWIGYCLVDSNGEYSFVGKIAKIDV